MTGLCCVGGLASRRLARRFRGAAASILPGAVLVLLPKCPLCLAAWLTVVTGFGFSAASAAWVRGMLVVFWISAVALVAAPVIRRQGGRVDHSPSIIRRRAFGRAPAVPRVQCRGSETPGPIRQT